MALTHRTRRRLYIWAISTLVGGAIGVMYSLTVVGQPKFAFPIGCALTGGVIGKIAASELARTGDAEFTKYSMGKLFRKHRIRGKNPL